LGGQVTTQTGCANLGAISWIFSVLYERKNGPNQPNNFGNSSVVAFSDLAGRTYHGHRVLNNYRWSYAFLNIGSERFKGEAQLDAQYLCIDGQVTDFELLLTSLESNWKQFPSFFTECSYFRFS